MYIAPIHALNELIKIGKKQVLPDEFLWSIGDLEYLKPGTGNKCAEVIKEPFHPDVAGGRKILKTHCAFREVVALQPVHYRLEGL